MNCYSLNKIKNHCHLKNYVWRFYVRIQQNGRVRKLMRCTDTWINKGVDEQQQQKWYRKKEEYSQRLGENNTNIPFSPIQLVQIIGRLHVFLRPGKATA